MGGIGACAPPGGIVVHLNLRCTAMPTVNPRVQVTLSPSLDALVKRMALYTRSSKSQVLRELLEAAEPALERAATLMEAASMAAGEAKERLARSLEKAQDMAEDHAAIHLDRLDRMTDDLVSQAEAVRGRRPARKGLVLAPAASPGAQNPPASNRGVKSAQPGGKRGAQPVPVRARRGVKS